jgi:hypothetical protein
MYKNYIKSCALKQLFEVIYHEMRTHHEPLSLHIEIYWLSRGKKFVWGFYKLTEEILFFILQKQTLQLDF